MSPSAEKDACAGEWTAFYVACFWAHAFASSFHPDHPRPKVGRRDRNLRPSPLGRLARDELSGRAALSARAPAVPHGRRGSEASRNRRHTRSNVGRRRSRAELLELAPAGSSTTSARAPVVIQVSAAGLLSEVPRLAILR